MPLFTVLQCTRANQSFWSIGSRAVVKMAFRYIGRWLFSQELNHVYTRQRPRQQRRRIFVSKILKINFCEN